VEGSFQWIPVESTGIHWNPAGTGGGHERPLVSSELKFQSIMVEDLSKPPLS